MPIKEAAIRQDGQIYTGKRHNLIMDEMRANSISLQRNTFEQGFIDESGNFLDRETAAKIALESSQIKKLISPPNLYSEDLY